MLVTALVASCLIVHAVTSVSAQVGYKPIVPQFTVKFVDNSYDVPPSTTTVTDPYTGKETTTTNPGYRVTDWNIEIMIKNQPFTPYTDADGYEHNLRYHIERKGHFEDEQGWKLYGNVIQSDSQYTNITLEQYGAWNLGLNSLPDGAQMDFRVKTEIVYWILSYDPPINKYEIVASSGWSDVHTITKSGETTLSSPPLQTATFPTVTSDGNGQPQYSGQTQPPNSIFANPLFTLVIGVLLGCVVIAVVVMILRWQPKTSTQTDTYAVSSLKLFSLSSTLLVRCEW
jgi:hypothetical protein